MNPIVNIFKWDELEKFTEALKLIKDEGTFKNHKYFIEEKGEFLGADILNQMRSIYKKEGKPKEFHIVEKITRNIISLEEQGKKNQVLDAIENQFKSIMKMEIPDDKERGKIVHRLNHCKELILQQKEEIQRLTKELSQLYANLDSIYMDPEEVQSDIKKINKILTKIAKNKNAAQNYIISLKSLCDDYDEIAGQVCLDENASKFYSEADYKKQLAHERPIEKWSEGKRLEMLKLASLDSVKFNKLYKETTIEINKLRKELAELIKLEEQEGQQEKEIRAKIEELKKSAEMFKLAPLDSVEFKRYAEVTVEINNLHRQLGELIKFKKKENQQKQQKQQEERRAEIKKLEIKIKEAINPTEIGTLYKQLKKLMGIKKEAINPTEVDTLHKQLNELMGIEEQENRKERIREKIEELNKTILIAITTVIVEPLNTCDEDIKKALQKIYKRLDYLNQL